MEYRSLLEQGVARGIITAEQSTALLALVSPDESAARTSREAPRAFNGITIAYGLGALVVLFAFAWFMVDRWRVLGDSGVFGLSVAYGAVFLLVAHVLHREGFSTARGVALLLAVGMAPLAIRALLRWTGIWTPEIELMCNMREHPFGACQGEPLAIEFAAVGAALVALRTMAFSPFMIPIAVVCVTLPERLIREMGPWPDTNGVVMGWRWVIVASVLGTVSYLVEQRRRDEDYAFWLWIATACATLFGGIVVFQLDAALRPWLGPVAILVIMASVYLRRRAVLITGLVGVLGFLSWLANDVFKVTTAFPLVLALLGVAIIIVTVWLQKRFPDVIRRMGGDPSKPPRLPGGVFALIAPAILGFMLMQDATSIDRDRIASQRSHARASTSRNKARRDSIAVERAMRRTPQQRP